MPSWWGSLTGRGGVCIVVGGAALGALITVLAGTGPGPVLGVSLVAATLAAALAIQPGAVYRIIPVPALAYLVMATGPDWPATGRPVRPTRPSPSAPPSGSPADSSR